MKFTAVVPVTRMETKTYDVDVSEKDKKIIKAYEKWYDDMNDENQQALVDAIKEADPEFDPENRDFEDYANNVIDSVRWEIYERERNHNDAVFYVDDVMNLSDDNFTLIP